MIVWVMMITAAAIINGIINSKAKANAFSSKNKSYIKGFVQ